MGFSLEFKFLASYQQLILLLFRRFLLRQVLMIFGRLVCAIFFHKILSRILNSRISKFLPSIISNEQAGFVKGRRIHENIALAHDLLFDFNREGHGGNVLVKLDMSKAYLELHYGCPSRVWLFGNCDGSCLQMYIVSLVFY
ncbi:hypothetical protein QQ045_023870 [Rhodiola kirilowii]